MGKNIRFLHSRGGRVSIIFLLLSIPIVIILLSSMNMGGGQTQTTFTMPAANLTLSNDNLTLRFSQKENASSEYATIYIYPTTPQIKTAIAAGNNITLDTKDILLTLRLPENTKKCGDMTVQGKCYAILEFNSSQAITIPQKYGDVFGMEFLDIATNQSIAVNHTYEFSYNKVNVSVINSTVCTSIGIINGTNTSVCNNTYISVLGYNFTKWNYSGATIPAGTSYLKLIGDKPANSSEDWVLKIINNTLYEWETWGQGDLININTGLVAYYPLNNTDTSNITTDSVSGTNISLYNVTSTTKRAVGAWVAGKTGNGINSTLNYAMGNAVNFANGTDLASINLWVRHSNANTRYAQLGTGASNSLVIYPAAGKGGFAIPGVCGFTAAAIGIQDNLWHMLTVVWNGTDILGYTDGVYQGTCSAVASGTTLSNAVWIAQGDTNDGVVTGVEDELAYWNRTLNITEIVALNNSVTYLSGQGGSPTPTLNISLDRPADGANFTTATISFGANLTSENQNISSVTIRVSNTTGAVKYENNITGLNTPNYNASWSNVNLANDGLYKFYAIGYGGGGVNASTTNRTIRVDTTAPQMDNLKVNPNNNTAYSVGGKYEFNVTVDDGGVGIGTVLIDFNGVNYTMTKTGSEYNYSFSGLSAGTYTYFYHSNDSLNNLGTTAVQSYTIAKATGSVTLLINGTAGNQLANYTTQTNASAATTAGTLNLYQDGVDITVSNNAYQTLASGYYNFTATASGNQNYTAATISRFANITKGTGQVALLINGTVANQTDVYKVATNASASTTHGTVTLYRNGGDITASNNALNIYGVGDYNFTAISSGDQNYSSATITYWSHITKATPVLTLSGTTSIIYGTASDITGSESNTGDADLTYNLFRNNISTSNPDTTILGAAIYLYQYNTTGGANYTNANISIALEINKSTPTASISLSPTATVTYPTQTSASYSESNTGDADLTYVLHRANVSVTSPDTQTLAADSYIYILNTTGGANYSGVAALDTEILTVNKGAGVIALLLNGTAGNINISYPSRVNASATSSTGQTITILRNGSDITASNNAYQNLSVAYYNFTASVAANQNYTAATISRFANITKGASIIYAYLNNTRAALSITNNTSVLLNATQIAGDAGTNIYLYNNGTIINNGTSPISNLTLFTGITTFNISAVYPGSENYTSSLDYLILTVQANATNIYPTYYNLTEAPPDNSPYAAVAVYEFNATWYNSSSVYIEFAGVNYTVFNASANIYNFTIYNLIAGTYNYYWHSNSSDGNRNITAMQSYIVPQTAGGGGGGGGQQSYTSYTGSANNSYLCQKTYEYINKYGKSNNLHFDELIKEIKDDKGYNESKTRIQDYIINWQFFCSNLINRTLDEKYVCNKIYYFLADNDHNYTSDQFIKLKEDITSNSIDISTSLLREYIDEYDTKCVPINNKRIDWINKNSILNASYLVQYLQELPECSTKFNSPLLDMSMPFLKIDIKNMSCDGVDFWRWVFRIENVSGNSYRITGFKIMNAIMFISAVLLLLVLYRVFMNMKGKKESKKRNEKN